MLCLEFAERISGFSASEQSAADGFMNARQVGLLLEYRVIFRDGLVILLLQHVCIGHDLMGAI